MNLTCLIIDESKLYISMKKRTYLTEDSFLTLKKISGAYCSELGYKPEYQILSSIVKYIENNLEDFLTSDSTI